MYSARAELALARGEPARALEITDQLVASAAHAKPDGSNILGVSLLRGQALTALGRFAEAERALNAARAIAEEQGALPMRRQIQVSLGKLYRACGRGADADGAFNAARSIVGKLAEKIDDDALRRNFEKGARTSIE